MRRLIFLLFYIYIATYHSLSFSQETAIAVSKIATVKQQSITQYHSAPGYTIALNNIEISSKQTGFISHIFVEAGDIVDKGQLLVVIDETINKQSIEQVKKEVEIASVTVIDAKKDVANFKRLRKGQSISEEKLRKARLLLARSQSSLLKAKAKLIETEATRPYLRLVSPEQARVVKRLADVGDLAVIGKAVLHLEVLKPLLFETAVPVQWINKLTKGQSIVIQFRLNHKIKEIVASITQIITLADRTTQQCTIKLQLPNLSNMPTGLFGQAQFILKEELALTIPEQAVVSRVGITGVFLVDNNRIIFTPIRLGRKYQNRYLVLSGLKQNEQVLLAPSNYLTDGMLIRYDH